MSLIIDFERDPQGHLLPNGAPVDLATTSPGNLHDSLFRGRLILRSGDVDLSTDGRNFLAMLNVVTYFPRAFTDAVVSGRGSVPFFDQDDVVRITVDGDAVQLSRLYSDRVIDTGRSEFFAALMGFLNSSLTRLTDYPELLNNSYFLDLLFGEPASGFTRSVIRRA
ncbi:hypothetical protein [Spirillospora sp. NPDC029432]|uniref:hypothetical protein n=1 Tax=Spirillospora sp. NPDC029432 TaxID=3154599 RepID=UPI0034531BC8